MLSDYARVELAEDNIKVLVVLPYLTATNFAKNALGASMGSPAPAFDMARRNLPPAQTAEFVAERLVDALRKDETEIHLAPERLS